MTLEARPDTPQRHSRFVPPHHNKASNNLFAGEGLCLQFVKNNNKNPGTSVKLNKVKHNRTRYACTGFVQPHHLLSNWDDRNCASQSCYEVKISEYI